MRALPILVCTVLSSPIFSMAAEFVKPVPGDYEIGTQVGYCIEARCQIFRGYPLSNSLRSEGPIIFRIERWFWGEAPKSQTIAVPYKTPPGSMGGDRTEAAWLNVDLSHDAPLTVVFAQENGVGVYAGEPVLVISAEREADIVRRIAEEARRLENSPELLADAVAALSRTPNPAFAGYLLAHLTFSKEAMPPGLAASLVGNMLGNVSVPIEALDDMAFWFLAVSNPQGAEGRAAAIRRFADLGRQTDAHSIAAGFAGLALTANSGDPISSMISPSEIEKLKGVYRASVLKGVIRRTRSLDVIFHVQNQ